MSLFPLAVLSGILTALCLPQASFCFLGWVSFAPLFWACRKISLKNTFISGVLAGFAFHAFALFWIYSTCRFAGINIGVSIIAWTALALFLGLNWGFICLSASWVSNKKSLTSLRPWIWALFWAAWEVLWLKTPRLCMDLPSYTQYRYLSFIQIDSIFGPQGLGFIIVFFNAALADIDFHPRMNTNPWIFRNLMIAGFLVFGTWIYGRHMMNKNLKSQNTLQVEILQPNINQYQKWNAGSSDEIISNFETLLSSPSLHRPDLIVWPEAALPQLMTATVGATIPVVSPQSVQLGAYQVVGAVIEGLGRLYNGAYYIDLNGNIAGFYLKRELVPFGEYVPWDFLRKLIGYLDQLGNLTPGPRLPTLFETKFGKIGCTICYEAVFPNLARVEAAQGARILTNITNDGWYKDTWGPYQHFYINTFRAVENRVYVLRAANTGISAVIDPWGRIVKMLPLNTRGRLDAQIPAKDPFPFRSFYARHGDWFGLFCLMMAAVLVFLRLMIYWA